MINKMNTFTQEQLLNKLEDENKHGNLKFKYRIAEVLASNYKLEIGTAQKLVNTPGIEALIDEDMEWSQHMGPHFWAKYIAKKYKNEINTNLFVTS